MGIHKPETINEPAHQLPVSASYDVLIAGGGVAGVAAAVAAGYSSWTLGLSVGEGLCTGRAGDVGQRHRLAAALRWHQQPGEHGLAEEMLKLSVADLAQDNRQARFIGIPDAWLPGGDAEQRKEKRYRVQFNPSSYLLALERWAVESGVTILYDTRICAVQRIDNRISHLIVNKKRADAAPWHAGPWSTPPATPTSASWPVSRPNRSTPTCSANVVAI